MGWPTILMRECCTCTARGHEDVCRNATLALQEAMRTCAGMLSDAETVEGEPQPSQRAVSFSFCFFVTLSTVGCHSCE